MKNLSDEQLISKYLNGEEYALETLIKRYLPLVYGLSRQYSGDKDKAADIAQEAFIKIWRNLKKFDTSKSFRSWLFVIVKNTALDWLRRKEEFVFSSFETKNEENSFLESFVDLAPSPSISAENRILSENINSHLKELPADHRLAFSMHVDEGLTFKEIAEQLKKPLNTIKSNYRRAIQALKARLRELDN